MYNFFSNGLFLEKSGEKGIQLNLIAQSFLILVVLFHFFTWSFPFPSEAEAEAYIAASGSDSMYLVKSILIRLLDHFFTFGYVKFAFVVLGVLVLLAIYFVFSLVTSKKIASLVSVIFGLNSYIFTVWHRVNAIFIVIFCFLACIYLFIGFITHWHKDPEKSAFKTSLLLVFLLLVMMNIEAYVLPFAVSIIFMLFLVLSRVYKMRNALLLTATALLMIIFFQYLADQRILFDLFLINKNTNITADIYTSLQALYLDNYQSSLWKMIHERLDFIDLSNCVSKRDEWFLLSFLAFGLLLLTVGKFIELYNRIRDRKSLLQLFYNPTLLLLAVSVIVFSLSLAAIQYFQIYSEQLFAYLIFSLVFFTGAALAFISNFDNEKFYVAASHKKKLHDIIYRPFTMVVAALLLFSSLFNIYIYVLPFRGSNYPSFHDALDKVWKSTGCVELSYSTPLYSLILNDLNKSAGTYSELLDDISNNRVKNLGCIVMPLVAKDHVYNYKNFGQKELGLLDNYLAGNYQISARLLLPFYQMDPAYPFNEGLGSEKRDFAKPYGHPFYGFGGMQDVVIYKPLLKNK